MNYQHIRGKISWDVSFKVKIRLKIGWYWSVLWGWDDTDPPSITPSKNEIWNLGKIYICLEEQGRHPPRFFINFQIVSYIFGLFWFHFYNKWNIYFLPKNRSLNVKKCLIDTCIGKLSVFQSFRSIWQFGFTYFQKWNIFYI